MTKKPLNHRIENEKRHGRFLVANNPHKIWNWDSPVGKIRWERRKIMILNEIPAGKRVLEVGCGTGLLSGEIAKMNVQLTAIDISPDLLEIAKRNYPLENITFLTENASEMTFQDGSFDAIVGSSVFHHLDTDLAIREFFRVLKPAGKIVFTEPNMMNPQIALQKNWPYLKQKMGDSPDETAFFRWKLKKKLMSYGFCRVEISPFDFLHPILPGVLARYSEPFFFFLEKLPLIREFAGSVFIIAEKCRD